LPNRNPVQDIDLFIPSCYHAVVHPPIGGLEQL